MARATALDDFVYEVDDSPKDGTAATVITTMFLRMDKFNVNAGDPKRIKAPAGATPALYAHVILRENLQKFGIHPRHLVGELTLSAAASACYETQPKRRILIPVLTLAQFATFKVFNKKGAATQDSTLITINHSADGSVGVDYKIIAKVPQRMV